MALDFKWEKHHTILTIFGAIATAALGYLIWRHENNVTQQENAANQTAQDEALQQYEQSLANSVQTAGTTSQVYGETSVPEEGDIGSESVSDSDPNIAEILSAFFPQNTTSSATATNPSSGSGQTSSPTSPSNPVTPMGPSSTPQPLPVGSSPVSPTRPIGASPIPISTRPTASVPLPTNSAPQSNDTVPISGPAQHVGNVR
jgi:hypothetical protein